MGYVHGNFRPRHVVLTNKDREVRLIGFTSSIPINYPKSETLEHTGIYTPFEYRLREGEPFLDVYAASVLVFLTYVWRHYFFIIGSYETLKKAAEKYLKDKHSDPHLVNIIN